MLGYAWRPPCTNRRGGPHHSFLRMVTTTRSLTWLEHGRHANGATRPTMQRMRAWRAATPPPLLPRGGPRLGRTSHGASCHDYIFQTSFLSPHNLFALFLPYSSRYPFRSSTYEVPIGMCQVFRLHSGLRALNGILLVYSVVRVICVVGVY